MIIHERRKLASVQHLTKTLHVVFSFNLSPICRSAIICPFAVIRCDLEAVHVSLPSSQDGAVSHTQEKQSSRVVQMVPSLDSS